MTTRARENATTHELAWNERKLLGTGTGQVRHFIEDGDELAKLDWNEGEGHRVGFGILPGLELAAVVNDAARRLFQ